MAALTRIRRTLIEDAAREAGLAVEAASDGKGWVLTGPPDSIHVFWVELADRNVLLARVLADCIEDGQAVTGPVRTWRFPAIEWGERPAGIGNEEEHDA